MRSRRQWISCLFLGVSSLAPFTFAQDKSAPKSGAAQPETVAGPLTDRARKKREQKLRKELETPYKKWLNEDVVYIITDEERQAWKRLATDEEREQFIEQFWLRRDPTPDTAENEFKEEHYRRVAYANERYASGIPGWKSDRGRIYITFGPPDEIESHPSGGSYERPPEEGGGTTSTYPFEQWRYRWVEGIGAGIEIEFVDPTMSGEYRMTMDPSEKDALLYVPNAGLTLMEQMGMASKTDRFNRTDGTHLGQSFGGQPAKMNEFERLEQFAKLQKPPAIKFKDLEAAVNSVIKFNILPFEDTVTVDAPTEALSTYIKRSSIYQKSIPLAPGMYRLNMVVRDVVGGNMNNYELALTVPRYDPDKVVTSSLVLADLIEEVPTRSIGTGQFVIGRNKVRPRINNTFHRDEKMGIYIKLYNFTEDEKTKKPSGKVDYEVVRSGTSDKILEFSEPVDKINGVSNSQA